MIPIKGVVFMLTETIRSLCVRLWAAMTYIFTNAICLFLTVSAYSATKPSDSHKHFSIIGGNETSISSHPYQVKLLLE